MRTSNVRVTRSYKKAIGMVALIILVVVAAVVYLTLTRAIITIRPMMQEVKTSFFVDVEEDGNTPGTIKGTINEEIITKTESFNATGTEIIQPSSDSEEGGDVIGSVTLTNKLDSPIELVATTRLLTEDKELFRLKNKVQVPAGGEVNALVYPDDPDSFDILDQGKLTIPGLSDSLQESVYAIVGTAISEEQQEMTVVLKEDVEQAISSLGGKIIQEKLNEIKFTYGEQGPVALALTGEVLESVSDNAVGTQADEFEVTVKMKVVTVFMEKSQILDEIENKLGESIEFGKELVNIDFDSLNYSIEKYDLGGKTANIKVYAVGNTRINENHQILDKDKIIGSTKEQVEIYYRSFDEIKDVEITLSPFWVKKVPSMKDKVKIYVR